MRLAMYGGGFLVVLMSLSTSVMAQVGVPEIDAGSISTGLGLLTGASLILRARWRSR